MSIPTSLIVVVLVLAWLVVLVPMVARRREAVPETEMAGGTFRVLRRSGERVRHRPAFRRPSAAAAEWEDPAGEDVSGNQELDEELLDDEYDDADGYDSDEDERDEYGEEYDEFDDDQADVPVVAEPAAAAPSAGRFGSRRSSGSHPYQPVQGVASDDDEAFAGHAEWAADESAPAGHADDVHLRPIPRRSGRGGYDPDAAELARRFKYSRRRRVAVILLLATVLFSAAAVLIDPVMWAGTAVFALLLVGYLAYLRRQVQIEASIRERRLARLRRARQIRPEYDMHRGENHVGGGPVVAGAAAASQVPPTGYRRGRQIVDLDDDDPSFDDLEYYQPLTYRRAAGQ